MLYHALDIQRPPVIVIAALLLRLYARSYNRKASDVFLFQAKNNSIVTMTDNRHEKNPA